MQTGARILLFYKTWDGRREEIPGIPEQGRVELLVDVLERKLVMRPKLRLVVCRESREEASKTRLSYKS